jgi:hypothetical protein
MSIIRVYNALKGGKSLINLSRISSIQYYKNQILFWRTERDDMFLGTGGGNKREEVTFKNDEEAEKEFNSIIQSLENYYKNKNS